MSAVLKSRPLHRFSRPAPKASTTRVKQPSPLERRVLDVVNTLIAEDKATTSSNITERIPGAHIETVKTAYARLLKRGLVPSRRENLKCSEVHPCGLCGDPKGYVQPGRTKPARRRVPGVESSVCRACYLKLWKAGVIDVPEKPPSEAELARDVPDRARIIRMERVTKLGYHEAYDSKRSSWLDALAEERSVWAEQAQRRLTGAGEKPVETPREGAEKARAVYWRVWRRLRGRAS